MKNLLSYLGILVIVSLTSFLLNPSDDQEAQVRSTYDVYFVDGEVERVKSYPMYLEQTGCVHLVDNQRFPKYCFVKKIILVE